MNTELILRIESAAESAVPAERTVDMGRWRAHMSRGLVRRLNSLALHGERPTPEDTADRLARLVALFEQAGLRPRIRQTSLDDWLDDHLEGWAETGETAVMVHTPSQQPPRENAATSIGSIEDWLEWIEPNSEQPERYIEAAESARRLASDNVVVFANADGRRVGAGRAVASHGLVGIYDLRVTEAYLRQGHASAITRDLLAWTAARFVQAYLQVEGVNHPALALYRSHGFVELYRYRYRSPARSSS